MRFVKMLSITAIMVAAMVFIGPKPAAATVLCRAEASESGVCAAGKVYPAGTAIKLETKSVEPLFTTSTENVTCKKSAIELKLETEGGPEKSASGQVTAFSFSECTSSKFKLPCALEAFNLPTIGTYKWLKASNGTFTFENGGKGEPGLTISCSFGTIKCAYEVKPTMEFIGGNPAQVIVSEAALKTVAREGFTTCPKTTTWSKATYRSIKPQQAYLAEKSAGSPPPAGSALCKVATSAGFCSSSLFSSKVYPAGQEYSAASTSVVLSAGANSVTCKESVLSLESKTKGGTSERAVGTVTGLTFGGCVTSKGESCAVEAVHLPYSSELLYTTVSNGELLVIDSGSGAPGVHFGKCAGVELGECGYTTGEMLIDVEGGNPAKATIAKGTLDLSEKGAGACLSEIMLNTASYTLTSPTAVYVAKEVGPTSVMCKVAPTEAVCPAGEAYPAEQEIQGEATKPFLVTSGEDVTCKSSKTTFKGKTKGAPTAQATGSVTALSFEGCELTSGASCTVEAINTPYSTELQYITSSVSFLSVKNSGKGEPGATISCVGGALACVFSAEPTLKVEAGNPATLFVSGLAMKLSTKEGFLKCPKEATWTATYKAISPTAVYVASE